MTTRSTTLSIVSAFLMASVLPAQQPAKPTPSAAPTPVQNAPINGATPDYWEGHEWRVVQFYDNDRWVWTLPLRVPEPYIAFSGGIIKGSLGCGQFTGTYSKIGGQLAISAKWADDKGSPCNDEEKDDAAKMLQTLANVRRVIPADYVLLLINENSELRVRLTAMQPGKDFAELRNTFWHLNQLEGSTADFSQVVINIDETAITFSTPSYVLRMPFQYHLLTGLKFQITPPDSKYIETLQATDQQVANAFENALQRFASYETKQGNLTFYGKDRQPLFVLNPIQSTGIENRQWRIAKYRGDGSGQADSNGLIDTKYSASVLFLNGRVEGSPGAGMWAGAYKLSGDELAFDGGFWFEGAWSGEQIDQGYLVSKAFKGDRRIEQRGDQILLRDKSGQAQILLVPF